ncbi:MAG: recombinase family protein [Pseudomonadota bacterium]
MTRAAIYARYSTDMQSAASIEDQVRLCQLRAEGAGSAVVETYADHGISGASTLLRPGVQALLQDAIAGKFDTVYAEALDRLSRDQEDIAAIYKRLSFAGVSMMTLSEGEISELHIGLKGTMNALFLKDLADKTRRGLRGRVEAGRSGGGKAYGYDVVKSEDDKGRRTINPAEAEIVRRIFRDYGAGKSPKAIAAALNREGVPGPSGRGWGQSTINGNRHRGTGVLNNELYVGRMVWNRLRYVKDPATGKRVSKPNPEADWLIQDVPELRIIDQELWDKAKARQGALTTKKTTFWTKQRPKYLLSGLLTCGSCGGGFSMVSKTQLGCSTARNKGTCSNRLTIKREDLEADLLHALQEHLMDPELCAVFCKAYTAEMNRLRREAVSATAGQERELAKITRQLGQMVDAIADGAPVAPIKDKMHALDARKIELEAALEQRDDPPPILHPVMAQVYQREVQRLAETLADPDTAREAAEALRGLIDRIVLTPDASGRRLVADLVGDLAGILTIASGEAAAQAAAAALSPALTVAQPPKLTKATVDQAKLVAGKGSQLGFEESDQVKLVAGGGCQLGLAEAGEGLQFKLVAGAGFEPATFRL